MKCNYGNVISNSVSPGDNKLYLRKKRLLIIIIYNKRDKRASRHTERASLTSMKWRKIMSCYWFYDEIPFLWCVCMRFIWSYISQEIVIRCSEIHARPLHGTVNHISNNVWFTLTVHDPNLSCCRVGGRWNRMAGVDLRVVWEVHGLPESSVYMSRCRPRRRPRPTVYVSTDSHSPETIDGKRLIAMTFKKRELDLIWSISTHIPQRVWM